MTDYESYYWARIVWRRCNIGLTLELAGNADGVGDMIHRGTGRRRRSILGRFGWLVARRWGSAPLRGVAAGALLGLALSASGADAATPAFVTVQGTAPLFGGSSGYQVSVFAEVVGPAPVSNVRLVPLSSQAVVSGASFKVSVLDTPSVEALAEAGNGNINLLVGLVSGGHASTLFLPTSSGATASLVAAHDLHGFTINAGTFPAPHALRPSAADPNDLCVYAPAASRDELTRIGEIHAANVGPRAAVSYVYTTTADSTSSTGVSIGWGPFHVGGSNEVTNNIGAGGGGTWYGGQSQYIDSTIEYTELLSNYPGGCEFGITGIVEATSAAGDVVASGHAAPTNPWGSCAADPHLPQATLSGSGDTHYSTSSQRAKSYPGAASFLISYTNQTGYSTTDTITEYNLRSGITTYVCGTGPVESSPVLYNSPH